MDGGKDRIIYYAIGQSNQHVYGVHATTGWINTGDETEKYCNYWMEDLTERAERERQNESLRG